MSQDRPDLAEMLKCVRELLDKLPAKVPEDIRYDVRVAAFMIGVAEREIAMGEAFDTRAQAGLATFLGQEGSVRELEKELAGRLRRGELDARLDEVLALLLPQIADKTKIVRPTAVDEIHR